MQRYFVSKDIINEKEMLATISDKENVHHIRDVMRMKKGDNIILLDNSGYEYYCEIEDISNKVALKILNKKENNNELKTTVDIYHGLVRKEKKEETLRRLVELGCHKYVPVMMERSVVKIDKYNDNLERVNTIIKECSEQAERAKLMKYSTAITFNEMLAEASNYDYLFLCYEESGRSNDKTINDYKDLINGKKVLVLVGPEGGISEKELELCKKHNFISIGLGKRILRTETAPLYIMSVLGYLTELGGNNE